MRLRRLLFRRFVLVVVLLLAAILTLTGLVFWREERNTENHHLAENAYRLRQAAEDQLEDLRDMAVDWGAWDDSYEYLSGNYPEFVAKEVTPAWFVNMRLEAVAHLRLSDGTGETLAFDHGRGVYDQALASAFHEEILRLWPKLSAIGDAAGFVGVPGYGSFAYAARHVTRSDGSGEPIGMVVVGRMPDQFYVNQLSESLALQVRLWNPDDVGLPPEARAASWESVVGQSYAVHRHDWRTMTGYVRFSDDYGNPLLVLGFDMPRSELISSMRLVGLLHLTFVILAALMALAVAHVLKSLVILPTERLATAARSIRTGERQLTDETGSDEFAVLSEEINRTVDRLASDRARAEAMTADLRKYQLAVENATDMIVITDADLDVLYANPATALIQGYFGDEAVGLNVLDLMSSSDAGFAERLRQTVLEERQKFVGETLVIRGDGKRYFAEMRFAPIIDVGGFIHYVVGIVRDVTQAKEVDRMKTEFVSVASHQLKTPLTGIRWFSEMLLADDSKLTADQKEALHGIYEVNDRLIRLVNDLLNVSRIDAGRKFSVEKASTDVMKIIGQSVTEQSIIAAKRDIKIFVELDAPAELVLAVDADKLTQVFHNLISNAIKYSPDGGSVRIGARRGEREVEFFVADGGIGIPPEDRSKLFSKFFRAGNVGSVEGTGLGLYIVKAIVEGHGGRVWVESEEGKGTTFRFTVPV